MRFIATLGRSGSSSQMTRATSNGEAAAEAVGTMVGQQLEQHDAQRVETVAGSPRACSGLAYSGVIILSAAVVGSSVGEAISGFRIFEIPKPSILGVPSAATRMFPGFRSR
jgi:hypothetical protein